MSDKSIKPVTITLVELTLKSFGPYAFGIIAVLVIWVAMVQPELERNRIDFKEQEVIVDKMQVVATKLDASMSTLDRAVDKLSRLPIVNE